MDATAKSKLVELVERQLTEVIRDASVVQRHIRRTRLAPHSSSHIGSSSETHVHERRLLDAQDINLALQWRGCDKLFVTGVGAPFAATPNVYAEEMDINTPLHNKDPRQKVIDLREYLASENTIPPPGEIGMKLFWLAVNGYQPSIPENPSQAPKTDSTAHQALVLVDAPISASEEAAASIQAKKLLPHILSEELRLYFLRVTITLEANKSFDAPINSNKVAVEIDKPKDPVAALTQNERALHEQTETVLYHIGVDSGIQELVPFLVQFVASQIYECLGQSDKPGIIWYCRTLVRFTDRMLCNPHLHLELHLHHLMPALLTCVVAKRVGPISTISSKARNYMADSLSLSDSHWSLRNQAAETVQLVCHLFGDQYTTLKARVLKTFCEACMDLSKPLPTMCGGIIGLSLFGPKSIDAFLLPIAADYWNLWEKELLERKTKPSPQRDLDMRQCQQALLNALCIYLNSGDIFYDEDSVMRQELFKDAFEERIIPMTVDLSSYAATFI